MFPDDAEEEDEDWSELEIDDVIGDDIERMIENGEIVVATNDDKREAIKILNLEIEQMEQELRLKKEVRDDLIREIQIEEN